MRIRLPAMLVAAALIALPAEAADLKVSGGDTVESLLVQQKAKRVTVRLRSGQELTGTVKEVTPRLLQLGALAGREFFDAVIPLEAIEALVIRTRD